MNAPRRLIHPSAAASRRGFCAARRPSVSSSRCRRYLRKASSYADRGTALHSAMALLIENAATLDDLVGETIGDYTITLDDVENALRPVLAYVETLLDAPGAEYYLEQRVVFPAIADTFGTADLIIRIGAHDLRDRFQVRRRRARPRALSGRRRGHYQRAVAVLRRGRAPFASRIFCRRRHISF